MTKARPHPRQDERVAALHSYEILDTDRDEDFDEIVKLAAAICGTAISVINFIDADRQWFKAEVGLGTRETPIATSICSHVILEEEFVEIHDTLLDPRMANNPLCLGDPGLRFYAGALLVTANGLPLGTLCVLDHQPMSLTPIQRDTIRVLAKQVMARLEMHKALRRSSVLRQEVDHRVKNSLQALSSFIRLAGRQVQSAETSKALSGIHSRVEAVAKLHEELYRTDAGPIIDLGNYVENLARRFAQGAPDNVELEISASPISVTSRQAVAAGTLINEFVANSFKHAFPHGQAGHVRITVEPIGTGNRVRIRCEDDGVGLPENSDLSTGGMGMQIVSIISAELRGNPDIRSTKHGLSIEIEFDIDTGAAPA